MIEYKNMTMEHYDEAHALWCSDDKILVYDFDDSRERIDFYLAHNPTTSFVALNDNKVVGTILAGHDGRRGFLYHLAVADGYRGQKIGTSLVEKANEALLNAGIHKTLAFVFSNNSRGKDFYNKINGHVLENIDTVAIELGHP